MGAAPSAGREPPVPAFGPVLRPDRAGEGLRDAPPVAPPSDAPPAACGSCWAEAIREAVGRLARPPPADRVHPSPQADSAGGRGWSPAWAPPGRPAAGEQSASTAQGVPAVRLVRPAQKGWAGGGELREQMARRLAFQEWQAWRRAEPRAPQAWAAEQGPDATQPALGAEEPGEEQDDARLRWSEAESGSPGRAPPVEAAPRRSAAVGPDAPVESLDHALPMRAAPPASPRFQARPRAVLPSPEAQPPSASQSPMGTPSLPARGVGQGGRSRAPPPTPQRSPSPSSAGGSPPPHLRRSSWNGSSSQ